MRKRDVSKPLKNELFSKIFSVFISFFKNDGNIFLNIMTSTQAANMKKIVYDHETLKKALISKP